MNRICKRKHKDRDEQIYKLRLTGITYQKLAIQFGVSRERIGHIFLREELRLKNADRLAKAEEDRDMRILMRSFRIKAFLKEINI